MIGTTTLTEKSGASKYRIGYTMPPSNRKPRNQMAQPTEKLDPSVDWSAKVLSVRDFKDERAFAELFAHFAPRIKGFLIKSGASAQVAEECAQESMVTVWHKAHLFDPSRASASTWIFTIARNKKIDAFRRAARPEPEELPWGPEPEPEAAPEPEAEEEYPEECIIGDDSGEEETAEVAE